MPAVHVSVMRLAQVKTGKVLFSVLSFSASSPPREVFVTGAPLYGRRLVSALVGRGHHVRRLCGRSRPRVPCRCDEVWGTHSIETFAAAVTAMDTIVHPSHPHPSPSKASDFSASPRVRAGILTAARAAARRISSTSACAPCAYHAASSKRALQGSAQSRSGLTATIVRPWYVLGPGHRGR